MAELLVSMIEDPETTSQTQSTSMVGHDLAGKHGFRQECQIYSADLIDESRNDS